jgi:hypothetical protein
LAKLILNLKETERKREKGEIQLKQAGLGFERRKEEKI